MPRYTKRFEPPRRQFPKIGPYDRSDLVDLPPGQINDIKVTPENVHQLGFFADPITPAMIRASLGSNAPAAEGILNEEFRLRWFRDWPTQDLDKIKILAENYVLHIGANEHMRIFIPAVYWVVDGKAVRSGPFSFRPRGGSFHVIDLWQRYSESSAVGQYERWLRMEHPHLNGGHCCLGTEESAFFNLKEAGDLYGLAYLFENLMLKYNPGSPFRRFRQQFPGSVSVYQRTEKQAYIITGSLSSIRTDYVNIDLSEHDTHEFTSLGYTIEVTDFEKKYLETAYPLTFRHWLQNLLSQNARDLISDDLALRAEDYEEADHVWRTDEPIFRLVDRILPGDDPMVERLERMGIIVKPGLHEANTPLDSLTIPYTKEHALDFPDENTNETEQAQSTSEAAAETEADSSTENASQAVTIPEGGSILP